LQGHLTNTKQSRVNSDAAQVLASSPKDVLKSTVFSCCRKVLAMRPYVKLLWPLATIVLLTTMALKLEFGDNSI